MNIAAVVDAVENFNKLTSTVDWVEVAKMRVRYQAELSEAQRILSLPWVQEVLETAVRELRERQKALAEHEARPQLNIPLSRLSDSIQLLPRVQATEHDAVIAGAPRRRIGFASWDE